MSIKTKNVFGDGKLVGGYVPRQLYEKFSLAVLYQNMNRSRVLKEYINTYLAAAPDERTMLAEIAGRLYRIWLKQCDEASYPPSFRIYMNSARESLSKRGIAQNYILTIVRGVRTLYEKEKKQRTRSADS